MALNRLTQEIKSQLATTQSHKFFGPVMPPCTNKSPKRVCRKMRGEKFRSLAFAGNLSPHIFRPQALFPITIVLRGAFHFCCCVYRKCVHPATTLIAPSDASNTSYHLVHGLAFNQFAIVRVTVSGASCCTK